MGAEKELCLAGIARETSILATEYSTTSGIHGGTTCKGERSMSFVDVHVVVVLVADHKIS